MLPAQSPRILFLLLLLLPASILALDRPPIHSNSVILDALPASHPHALPNSAEEARIVPCPFQQPRTHKTWAERLDNAIDSLGGAVLGLLGLHDDASLSGIGLGDGGLSALTENSVYVELTNSLHSSRPSSFGPHLSEPFRSLLFPISAFTASDDPRGCGLPTRTRKSELPQEWIALIERGKCPFSNKVRSAMHLGASAVIFGDMAEDEGGIPGSGGLLTPWSPDDSSDITIPSSFISRASYLSILQTWESEQDQLSKEPIGLIVIMSKDEVFVWPLLDLLLLLLFLPSILTLLTIFTQRLRTIRQQKLDRAPRDAVERLPVFLWLGEKPLPEGLETVDEERQIGSVPTPPPQEPTETTSLLPPPHLQPRRTFFSRFLGSARHDGRDKMGSPLPTRVVRTFAGMNSLTECSICLSEFERGDEVMQLPCGHLFHKDEIKGWLLGSKRLCPVCRASITPDSTSSSAPSFHVTITSPTRTLTAPLPIAEGDSHRDSEVPIASSSSASRY